MESRRVCADRSCHPNATIIRAAGIRCRASVITTITTAPRLREDRLLNKRISAVNSILHFNSTLTTSYGLTPPLCGERALGSAVGVRGADASTAPGTVRSSLSPRGVELSCACPYMALRRSSRSSTPDPGSTRQSANSQLPPFLSRLSQSFSP